MELLSLIPVVGFALAWQRWQQTTASSGVLHAVSSIVITLFLASLCNLLYPVTLLLMFAGVSLAVAEGYLHVRRRVALRFPIVMFVGLCAAYWFIQADSSYYFYDEYSHWGVYLKDLLAHDRLWDSDTNALHPQYLPGTALWQYFFAVFSRNIEGASYLAQFAILITPLLVLWERVQWKNAAWSLGILALVIVITSNFGHGFTSLYVDHLLGAWFAGVLLNFLFEYKSCSARQIVRYLLPISVLVLFKSPGAFFATAVACTMSILWFSWIIKKTEWRKQLMSSAAFPAAAVVLCIAILSVWQLNRSAHDIMVDETSTEGMSSRLVAGNSVLDGAQQEELTRRYVDVVMHQQISKDEISAQYNAFSYSLMPLYEKRFRLTTASLLGLSLVALLLLLRFVIPPEARVSWLVVAGCTWGAAVTYVGLLYLGYRYVSVSEYGLILSSYVRYAHSMLLPVVLMCFAPLLPAFATENSRQVKVAGNKQIGLHSIAFTVALLALFVFERPYLKPLYSAQRPPAIRLQLDPMTRQVRTAIGESRLWVFFPNDVSNGFIGQMLQYQLSPGRTYVEEDATTLLGDQIALKNELGNWEYAWFVPQNPEFEEALERLLGRAVTSRVYRISVSGGNTKLEPVEDVFQNPGGLD